MSAEYWANLYASLVTPDPSGARPARKPTDELIAAFERQAQFTLPQSYVEYVKVFGPGVLAWEYQIKAPGYPELGTPFDLTEFHHALRDRFAGRSDVLSRLVFFGDTATGEDVGIGWDPDDMQNAESHEY